MHDDYTVQVSVQVSETLEFEVSSFHTEDEAKDAAVRETVEAICQGIQGDPKRYITIERVWEPE